jgi:hypothetical protein
MPVDVTRLIAKVHDAGLTPDAWPEALEALTDATGIAGAACIAFNKATGRVDWVRLSGLSAAFESKYLNHYAPLDPFSPLLNVEPGWGKLSECLPASVLARSEWYNDFVLACGVRDIVGTRLVETPSHFAIFGLHQQIGRRFGDETASILDQLTPALNSATLTHLENLFGAEPDDNHTKITTEGARYYLHVTKGKRYPDEIGQVFSTREEAIAHASSVATELAQDKGWNGFVVSLTDEQGGVLASIPVSF